jgi:hypothetical protein
MKIDRLLKMQLTLIIALLGMLAVRPLIFPPASFAQSPRLSGSIYIEPGVAMLRAPDGSRQVLGKVVVDLGTGKIWGFPTTVQQPYPVDISKSQPPTSVPFLLGKYDLSALTQ